MNDARRRPVFSDYTPQSVWNYALPDGWTCNANPVFDKASVIISAVNDRTSTGGLWAIDAQTQVTRWSQSKQHVFFSSFDSFRVGDSGPNDHSGLMLAARMTFAHLSISTR